MLRKIEIIMDKYLKQTLKCMFSYIAPLLV